MGNRFQFILIACLLYIGLYAGISFAFKDVNFFSGVFEKNENKNLKLFSRRVLVKTDSIPALPDSLAQIDTLLIAHKSKYRMNLYAKGKLLKTYFIALGQAPIGHKQKQGDNRTPEGVYKIIQKSRGPFSGDYSAYFGVAWMRLNYPNNADAINGFKNGLISEAQKNAIVTANNNGREPLKNTKLGGGIGIHGWNGNWPGNDRQDLTWGCISVQNVELADLYSKVPVGTVILILP